MKNKKLNIVRAGDQNFWAYHWVTKEHSLYTKHNMVYQKHNEVDLNSIDVLYIHSPDITTRHATTLPLDAKEKGIKVIGAYAGNPNFWSPAEKRTYSYADLIVTISPQTYSFAKFHYTHIPVIYLPESIDTNFFTPKSYNKFRFNVGWAGGAHKKVKRFHIAQALDYPVYLKDDWKQQRNSQSQTLSLDEMKKYYQNIDVLLVTSESECQPRTVLEAMATGKPVIATDVGSVAMLLDKEWVVPVNPEKNVIKEINYRLDLLKKYPELRKKVGQRNLEFVTKYFSWKSNKDLWDCIFENVYNDNIDAAIKESKKFLFPFKHEFCERFLNFKNIQSEPSLMDLIKNLSKVANFFFVKESCKNAIAQANLTNNTLHIGTNNLDDYKKLTAYINDSKQFSEFNTKYSINIYYEKINNVKQFLYKNITINVPAPVVPYLKKIYGNDIMNTLTNKD